MLAKKTWADSLQIQLSGSGGQGLILVGIILAEAALVDGYYVIQTQVYGPEARGGASRAEVILASEPIDYPHVEKANILLALTQEAYDKYVLDVAENALIITDSLRVERTPDISGQILRLPIIQTARDQIKKEMVANIVALGALNAAAGLVTWPALENAIGQRVPKAFTALNLQALAAGKNLVSRSDQ